jgi:hypothetical protein
MRTYLTCFAILLPLQLSAAIGWNPIQPEELTRKTSVVEKNADAEAIFWEIHLSNVIVSGAYPQKVLDNYIRIKIYTERGRESQSSVEIPYFGKSVSSGVSGRTILPNGKLIELSKDAIFDKVVAKGGGYKEKVISFAMPGVVPGALIEYSGRRCAKI